MDIEQKIFLKEVKDLFQTNKNEITTFFCDEGILGCIEICQECGRPKVRLTDMVIPQKTTWKKISKKFVEEMDVEISDDTYDDLVERGGICDCDEEGLDNLKKEKSY